MAEEMKIEQVPLETLVEDPENARKHGPQNMKAIKDSLAFHGQVEPLVVQRSRMRIVGGNGRFAAMKELGSKDAKVVFVDLSDSRARALGIALNRTSELSEWDFQRLADALQQIDSGEFDVATATGFDGDSLEQIANWTPSGDIEDPHAEWKAMPEFKNEPKAVKTIFMHFKTEEDVQAFSKLIGQEIGPKTKYAWYPPQERRDLSGIEFEGSR